ncbi:MAG: hypothetical protein K2X43_01000 [Hyphomonadaceae bacterium]|jgi:hypothetical protein|nr:hypothetical protein [Hyphomonadaceae bacterium]
MNLYRLFNRRTDPPGLAKPASSAPGAGGPEGPPAPVGAFITQESFVSFSVVTAFVSTAYGVASVLFPVAAKDAKATILAVICLAVGAAIYAINVTDLQNPPTSRQMIVGAFFAFANSIQLFAAAYGVTTLAKGA